MRWTPDDVRKTWQDALLHRVRKRRVARRPPRATQFCIADTFVAIPAFTWLLRFSDWWKGTIEPLTHPAVAFASQDRLIVYDVVNVCPVLSFSIQQKEECGRDIVSMDLIHKTIVFQIYGGRAVQESGQQRRALRSVDPSESHNNSIFVEDQFFHFQEDAAGLAEWFCFALFGHP